GCGFHLGSHNQGWLAVARSPLANSLSRLRREHAARRAARSLDILRRERTPLLSRRRRGGWFKPPINRRLNEPPRPRLSKEREHLVDARPPLLRQGRDSACSKRRGRYLKRALRKQVDLWAFKD